MNHQRTIDFLNESFKQEANIDLTSIDYMENIKQINIDWIRIKALIAARIDVRVPREFFRAFRRVSVLGFGTTEYAIQ